MAVTYIETFEVPGLPTIGIEDYAAPGPHFMNRVWPVARDNDHARFQLWSGGCGFGRADTLDHARVQVMAYARDQLERKRDTAARELETFQGSLDRLGHDIFNLAQFKVAPTKKENS